MAAGAAGLAALHDGAASAAEPSLLPPEAKSLEETHRSPEQVTEPPGLQDGADDPERSGSMGSRRAVRGDRLSWRAEAGLGQHRDRKPVAERHAQLAERASLVIQGIRIFSPSRRRTAPAHLGAVRDSDFGRNTSLRS